VHVVDVVPVPVSRVIIEADGDVDGCADGGKVGTSEGAGEGAIDVRGVGIGEGEAEGAEVGHAVHSICFGVAYDKMVGSWGALTGNTSSTEGVVVVQLLNWTH